MSPLHQQSEIMLIPGPTAERSLCTDPIVPTSMPFMKTNNHRSEVGLT